ncbi:exopolysaccharide production protein ExoZ [Brevundimonas denitrificans]|uniref:Exopolysaccharide production protein ExoZ n=1 Tax=Brevundimonas denitrificans TaxID=1443434 RepID=A0ABQ6BIE6_9CAUL|nr:acyltransferase [Brevundimonas denitrificans]GLS01688.1 exopolysaccharide production protein ExoZ [Brevundimonas denitrificans]
MVLHNIQALRGAAALAVIFYHIGPLSGEFQFPIGRAGVDVFFVVSGFIMAHIWGRSDRFLLDRAIRVLPLYWIITAAAFVGFAAFPALQPETPPNLLQSFLLLPGETSGWALIVAWTLVWEMIFYGLLTVFRHHRPFLTTGIVLVAMTLTGIVFRPVEPVAAMLTATVALSFIGGILIARCKAHPHARIALALGIVWFAAYAALGLPLEAHDFWRGVWFAPPAMLLVYGAVGVAGRIRPLEHLGDASYSLYLTHVPVMAVLAKTSEMATGQRPPALLLLIATIAAAWLTYVWIERLLMAYFKKLRSESRPVLTIS